MKKKKINKIEKLHCKVCKKERLHSELNGKYMCNSCKTKRSK